MPTLASPISIARELAGTDSNGLTDTLAIDFSNYASMKLMKMLIDKGIDAAPVQEATRNLTDGTGTYLYPSDMFYVPKSMEINWTNPSDQNQWKQVDKMTDTNLPPNQTVSWLRKNQPSGSPLIDYRGDYFEIFPTPNSSTWGGASGSTLNNALRLFYYLQPTAGSTSNILYAATTDTMTNPAALDYFSFAELIKSVYEYSLKKITESELETIFDKVVGKLIHIIQGDGMMPTKSKGLQTTGWEF